MDALLTPLLFADLYGSAGDLTAYHRGGTWHLKRRSRSRYQGTAGQNSVMTVHRRAIAAWQSLPAEQQDLWESYSLKVEPHRPPFDHTTRISGYNLFVSASHGFATLGNEHVPTPRAFDSFPPFAVDLVSATNLGGKLCIQLQVPIAPVFLPERYRLLAKIQFTEPGKGRNPGLMRNHLASPFDAASNATVVIPDVASQSQYQVHARFVLLDTETGYRSQYLQQSFLLRL